MNIDLAFHAVYGRNPNAEETSRFNRLAKELGIRDNDAIWAMVFLLGHHLDLASQMPTQIERLAARSLEQYTSALLRSRKSAEAELLATKARIEENVSHVVVASAQREIARAAQSVARDTARRSWLQWLGSASVIGMLLFGGAFYWGYDIGDTLGYSRALDVRMTSAWAATAMAQAAYKFDKNGDLIHLIKCDSPGWKVEKTAGGDKGCFVHPKEDGSVAGWLLP